MNLIIFNFFSLSSLKTRFRNKRISFLSLFDKECQINCLSKINRFVIFRKSQLGAFSYIGPNSNINNATIGKFCSISKNVNIGAPIHPTNFISTNPIFFREANGTGSSWVKGVHFNDLPLKTIIGNDVWIGMNVSIMGGVKIGDGAIIGAHALVTKDVPPYAIVGGVPAKILKYRFTETMIKKLLNFEWWNLPQNQLKKFAHHFSQAVTIEKLEELSQELKTN